MMNFKSEIHSMSELQQEKLYGELESISRRRKTDLSNKTVNYIIQNELGDGHNLLDVGCGKGYLLTLIKRDLPAIDLTACDVVNVLMDGGIKFNKGSITSLPFIDNQFDICLCSHTLEHILDLKKAVSELLRITSRKIIVVVPRQRQYYYTLDEHVNFFFSKEPLIALFGLSRFKCIEIGGDWVYIGWKSI